MSLSSLKLYDFVKEQIQLMLTQVDESLAIANSTVKPVTFFSRLSFLLNRLLDLAEYEKYGIFTGLTPSQNYNIIVADLENVVDSFITRSFSCETEKANLLKTEKGRRSRLFKYAHDMIEAFQKPTTFYAATNRKNHYTGCLYTDNNLQKLHCLFEPYLMDEALPEHDSIASVSVETNDMITYVETGNIIYRADGQEIQDEEIPRLIQIGLEKALERNNLDSSHVSNMDFSLSERYYEYKKR